jgi:hypothetical protein
VKKLVEYEEGNPVAVAHTQLALSDLAAPSMALRALLR